MTTAASDLVLLAASLAAGALLGAFYFGGLWLTVRRLPSAKRPALALAVSFLIRAGITLAFFYVIMAGDWKRLLACLLGFFAMRHILVRRVRRPKTPSEAEWTSR